MTRVYPNDFDNDLSSTKKAVNKQISSKTWNLFSVGEGDRYIDGLDALRQSVSLALETPRYAHLIYSFDYGNELLTMFGHSNELVQTEGSRLIKEALSVDERIESVDNFKFNFTEDSVEISFEVKSKLGNFVSELKL